MALRRFALRTAWPFLRAVVRRFNEDQSSVLSGYIAYSLMLSAMPFLIFATALTGFVVGAEQSQAAVNALFAAVPEHVALTLEPVLHEVLGQRRTGILTLSALGAIWAASNGVEAVRIGLDRAYDVDDARHVALGRLISVAVVVMGFVVFTLLCILIVFAPLAFALVEEWTHFSIPWALNIARYLLAAAVMGTALWGMHYVLPSRSMRGFVLWPGIVASVVIWAVVATGMSVYLAYAPSYTVTYGALSGVIVTLLFFYLTGVALIFGAQVNAAVNAHRLGAARRPDAPAPQGR